MSVSGRAPSVAGAEPVTLRTPWMELAALAWGPADGVPVLALHGWLDNAASFARLAPLLRGCRVVALDLPGHGWSAHRPAGASYHFADYVRDVVAAMDALGERMGWRSCALLGHSLGANIASFVPAAAPGRVRRLALIEGTGPTAGAPEKAPAQLALSVSQAMRVRGKQLPAYGDIEGAVDARSAATGLDRDAARPLVERGVRATAQGGVTWRTDAALTVKTAVYLTEPQVLAFLRAVDCPALLVRGRSGYLREREAVAARLEAVPGLRVVDLPGGHHLHLETPEPVAEAVRPFLADG